MLHSVLRWLWIESGESVHTFHSSLLPRYSSPHLSSTPSGEAGSSRARLRSPRVAPTAPRRRVSTTTRTHGLTPSSVGRPAALFFL